MRETTKVKGIIVLGRLLRSFVNSTGEWYSCASEVQLAARKRDDGLKWLRDVRRKLTAQSAEAAR